MFNWKDNNIEIFQFQRLTMKIPTKLKEQW